MRLLVISASPRFHGTCPDEDGKTLEIARAATGYVGLNEGVEVDFEDLSVKGDGNIIQPCKGCQSTAGGYHCHWPCSCYGPGSAGEGLPDIMHDRKLYARFIAADGFAIFTPINWHGPSTEVKAMIDRLVCADKTIPVELARRAYNGDIKNRVLTRAAYAAGGLDNDVRNWFQDKIGAMFVHGDRGADEEGRYPNAPAIDSGIDKGIPRDAVAHEVAAFRNMGVIIPEDLWVGAIAGPGLSYAQNNDQFTEGSADADLVMDAAMTMMERLYDHVQQGMG